MVSSGSEHELLYTEPVLYFQISYWTSESCLVGMKNAKQEPN